MKLLYVCRANVGRSQMAAAYHNHIYRRYGIADSTGTCIPQGKNLVKDVEDADLVIQIMQEDKIDISQNQLKQLSVTMLPYYDKIIVMAEKETCPDFLRNSIQSVLYWNIEDAKGKDFETTRRIKDEIKQKIDEESEKW
ncbi:MAG: hypothetical protein AABX16_03000 [Nanoarchaeota archaeon]